MNKLVKLSSITKKIVVALLGAFLLAFVLFHMSANLLILRHDDGAWYSAFCHFMGTNWIVKAIEIVLLATLALHIVITIAITISNRHARPIRYHETPRSKTHKNSKLMAWTGILIFAFLVMHFCQFYFVKIGWVKGAYMVKVEKLSTPELNSLFQMANAFDMTPHEVVNVLEIRNEENGENTDNDTKAYLDEMHNQLKIYEIIERAENHNNFSRDHVWIRHLTYEERQTLREVLPESAPEPDFYFMTRSLFKNPIMVLLYLIAFVALFMHMRHAFPAAFQTLGLSNYKYAYIIEIVGTIYTYIVTIGFSIVVLGIFFGL